MTRQGVRFTDGKEEQFDTIILATGYRSNVPSWLKVKQSVTHSCSFYISFCPHCTILLLVIYISR